ncbi:hypothetical protein C7N43_10270 [Sphingobacteriales bacterium UPWRP_1]|nr:hypothetical protein C7N43_10270 [Sphingobacteriales bacterium UPWRP_1]
MESLQYLIKHPYIVVNKISEALYKENTLAAYARLRSRASGRHRFTEEEVQALIKIFGKLSAQLRKLAARLEKMAGTATNEEGKSKNAVLKVLNLPMVNWKPVISKAAGNLQFNYYRLYDSLRSKSSCNPQELLTLKTELESFAADIDTRLEMTKKEAKTYPFGFGRGAHSHILA